nr:hypothetical protein [Tanacetum cinerariifolium]
QKATKEKPSKASTAKPPKLKPTKEKSTKTTLPQPTDKGKVVKVRKEATQPLTIVEGKGKAIVTEEQAAYSLLSLYTPKRRSTTDQFIFQRRTLPMEASSTGPSAQAQDDTSANIIRDSPSLVDAEIVMDEDQAGPDLGENRRALAGPDPRPTHDEFMVDMYFKFINDKSTKDEPEKPNVEAEVVSTVIVPIYQASYSIPLLSTTIPVIDLSPPKPTSSTIHVPIVTVTTTLPPPPQQQSIIESEIFTLKLRDLPHKIDEAVREFVKEAVHIALQAPLQDRFRELPEADMKEILYQWMFKTTTYQALAENSLLEKTGDMRTFMHWYCQQMGKIELTQADLEGQAYEGVKAFYPNIVYLYVVSIKAFSHYGYDYLNEITLRRVDYQEYMIVKKDFKSLHPCDFEDLNLLLLQDFQLGIKSYQKQLNLTKPGWDAKGFEYKHNYIIIDSPRPVVFPIGNNEQKIMRFNEIYKFSDGTLTNIMEALDFRVKEYKHPVVELELEIVVVVVEGTMLVMLMLYLEVVVVVE